jgi:hypothetical protein
MTLPAGAFELDRTGTFTFEGVDGVALGPTGGKLRYNLIRFISLSAKTLFHVFPPGHISHKGGNRHFHPTVESLKATWQVIFRVNCQCRTIKGKYRLSC